MWQSFFPLAHLVSKNGYSENLLKGFVEQHMGNKVCFFKNILFEPYNQGKVYLESIIFRCTWSKDMNAVGAE